MQIIIVVDAIRVISVTTGEVTIVLCLVNQESVKATDSWGVERMWFCLWCVRYLFGWFISQVTSNWHVLMPVSSCAIFSSCNLTKKVLHLHLDPHPPLDLGHKTSSLTQNADRCMVSRCHTG